MVLHCITVLNTYAQSSQAVESQKVPLELVAHAGGGFGVHTYTNSLEAFNASYYKGFRFFEVDMDMTSDSQIVLLHGWSMIKTLFGKPNKVYSLREFKSFKMKHGLTQMSFADLAEWMRKYKDVHIITDTKSSNGFILYKILKEYEDISDRVIPQVYRLSEYEEIKDMGFERVILTLYKTKYTDSEILGFLGQHSPYAITMSYDRGYSTLPRKIARKGVFVYAYTVNDPGVKEVLMRMGVKGVYTDFMKP